MVWGEGGGRDIGRTGVRLVFMAGHSLWITLPMEHKHKEVSLWPEVSLSLFFKNFVSQEDVGAWLGGRKSDGLICNGPPCEENGKQRHRLSWQRWARPPCCCWNFPYSGVVADTVMAGGAQNCVSGPQLVTVRCQVRLPGSSSALSPPCILLHREPESHWMGNSLYFSAPRPTKLPTLLQSCSFKVPSFRRPVSPPNLAGHFIPSYDFSLPWFHCSFSIRSFSP